MYNYLFRVLRLVWPLILLIILISSGCVTSKKGVGSHATTTTEVAEPDIGFAGEAVGYSIRSQEDESWATYQITSGSSFHGFFQLYNQQSQENYLFTCLINYRQTSCNFDDQPKSILRLTMGDLEERAIAFSIPPLIAGVHDVTLLAFAKPDNHDLSREYRLSTDFNYLYAPRIVLLVGDEPWQAAETNNMITATQTLHYPLSGVVVNREEKPLEIRAWLTETVHVGETVDFFIHLGNKVSPESVAVITFLDYEQIPLDGATQWVSYLSLPTNTYIALPGHFEAPQQPGVYEFITVLVHNPFHMLEDPPLGQERNPVQISTVPESSIRVAINVIK